jgi:hypothetical protein
MLSCLVHLMLEMRYHLLFVSLSCSCLPFMGSTGINSLAATLNTTPLSLSQIVLELICSFRMTRRGLISCDPLRDTLAFVALRSLVWSLARLIYC